MNLKFKAWDKEEKKFYDVVSINFPLGKPSGKDIEVICDDENVTEWRSIKDVELLQFVGLFDDNGEEIYEGYIVEVIDPSETKTSHKSVVRFGYNGAWIDAHPVHKEMGAAYIRKLYDYCDYGIGRGIVARCKIVGNIYQNPELLNEGRS
jgi:uncharacterized phage protein (TIGR01671 family)